MKIKNHLAKISWALADKALFILYGFIFLIIIHYTNVDDYGLYSILIVIHTWIFTISDSFSLQSIIQFGFDEKNRKKVNLISLITHIAFTISIALIILLFSDLLSGLYEPRIKEVAFYLPFLTLTFIPRTFSQKLIYRNQSMLKLFISNAFFFGTTTIYLGYIILTNKHLSFNDLVYSYLLGGIFSSVITLVLVKEDLQFSTKGTINIKKIIKFNWKTSIIGLLYSFPKQFELIILKFFFSLEIIGLYSAAKTLFRIFEELISAVTGLLYPSYVKQIESNRIDDAKDLLIKSTSYVFWSFIIISLIIVSPVGTLIFDYIIPEKFNKSMSYFYWFLAMSPFLSFHLFYTIFTALKHLKVIFIAEIFSIIIFLIIFLFVSYNNLTNFISFGLMAYNIIFGVFGYFIVQKRLHYKFSYLFRLFDDLKYFLLKIKKTD